MASNRPNFSFVPCEGTEAMTRFVKLTRAANANPLGGTHKYAYVNPAAVDVVVPDRNGGSILWLREGGDSGYVEVAESPEEVISVLQGGLDDA